MIADDHLLDIILNRCKPLIPTYINNCKLVGINARFRFFRYFESAVYRPHSDGSWPGSGLDKDGKLVDDLYQDRVSKLTFLIYLNSDFIGGSTTFFLPNADKVGIIETRSVEPTRGSVLCFPHGDSEFSLIHEGSAVMKGTKYVIRSDVLYRQRCSRETSNQTETAGLKLSNGDVDNDNDNDNDMIIIKI